MVAPGKSAYAEESAEVEVLFANLEKINGLTKKIQGAVNRLDSSGKDVQTALGPIHGSTKHLRQIHSNVDRVLSVINRFQAPMEQRNQEETIIRSDPLRTGLNEYVASLHRAENALRGLRATNIGSNQTAIRDTQALVKYGSRQIEEIFKKTLLSTGASKPLEPLGYITKEKLFPIIPREEGPQLKLINSFVASSWAQESHSSVNDLYTTAKIFAEVRGTYVARSLANMSAATLSTARRGRETTTMYKKGDCQISYYKVALHGMLAAEYDNIRMIFPVEEYAKVLLATSRLAMTDFGKTLKDLNAIVLDNLISEFTLAFDVLDTVSKLGSQLGDMTGVEMQRAIAEVLQPIHATAKLSLPKIIDYTKNHVRGLQSIPQDGSPIATTVDTMERLRALTDFLTPVLGILASIGDSNWNTFPATSTSSAAPSIRSLDNSNGAPTQEGLQLFSHYCSDVIDALMAALDNRARLLLKSQGAQAVFLLNSITIIDGMTRKHDVLGSLLLAPGPHSLQPRLDSWRGKNIKLYLNHWSPATMPLLDVQYTGSTGAGSGATASKSRRSGTAPPPGKDSESIVSAMPSREREALKEKFRNFAAAFDDLASRHKAMRMEPSVRTLLAKEISHLLEPLYGRFWDRYHEVDRKGKHVKYDKNAMSTQLAMLM